MACLMACSSDETTEAKPAQELLMVEKEVSMPASETTWSVKITAAAQTGPAQQPRPASSTPAIKENSPPHLSS